MKTNLNKNTEQTVDEVREYAESIVETVREPLIVLDANLRVISANKSFYSFFKVNSKETRGQLIYDLGNQQWDIPLLRKLLEEILPNNTSFNDYEVEHDFPQIGKRIMLLNARRIPRAPAKPRTILLAIEDITERKRLEKELSQAGKEEFRAVFDAAADGILIADKENKKFYDGNKSICRMLGYSAEEIKSLGVMDIHPEKDFPYVIDQFERQAKGEFTLAQDLPVKRKDGSVFYADVNATAIKIAGKIYQMGFFHDTTEHKRIEGELKQKNMAMLNVLEDEKALGEELKAEKAGVEKKVEERTRELKEEQARLMASIEGLPLGFILVNNDNKIIITNPAIEKIFGRGDISMDWIDTQLGGKLNLSKNCQKCRQEKKMIDLKDIEYGQKFLSVLLAPVMMIMDHEEVIGKVILIEDITEAKILERSKDEFFSIASHELRTPLTAIRGNTSMIQQMYGEKLKGDKDLWEMIEDVHHSSVRLISIVNDFLELSRLETGKIKYKIEKVDLVGLLKEIVQEYSVIAAKKNLSLRLEEPKVVLPAILADRDRVKQVVINLIGNSLKVTKNGGVILRMQPDNQSVKVSVEDTGSGISPDGQKLLFRKFQQAGESIYTRDVAGGTGLGLYISKLIIEAMGGKITLEKTEVGKGSTFSFSLPISKNV